MLAKTNLEIKQPTELLREQVVALEEIRRELGEIRVALKASSTKSNPISQVEVTDFSMSFGSMVMFLIKWALASIPAMMLLGCIGVLVWSLLAGFIARFLVLSK